MIHVPVTSSNVQSVGYDPAAKEMEVRFHNGGLYRYEGVSPEEHAATMTATSVGKHLAAHIKTSKPYRKVG